MFLGRHDVILENYKLGLIKKTDKHLIISFSHFPDEIELFDVLFEINKKDPEHLVDFRFNFALNIAIRAGNGNVIRSLIMSEPPVLVASDDFVTEQYTSFYGIGKGYESNHSFSLFNEMKFLTTEILVLCIFNRDKIILFPDMLLPKLIKLLDKRRSEKFPGELVTPSVISDLLILTKRKKF